MTRADSSSDSFLAAVYWLAPIFYQYRVRLFLGFIFLVSVDFLQLLIPRILKQGVDSLSQQSATATTLLQLGLFILIIAAGVALFRFFWRTLILGFSRLLERQLRDQIFHHLLQLDRPFFIRWSTGQLMAHSSNDLSAIQMACGMGMVAAVDALVMSTAAIGFMLAIDVRLTIIVLLPMPILALLTKILSRQIHKHFSVVQEQFGRLTEFVRSSVGSIRLIKGYCLEHQQEEEFAELGKEYVRSNLRVAMIQGLLYPLATLTGNLGMLLVLLYGGRMVLSHTITLGDFVAYIAYLTMLIWPMMAIGWVANIVQRGLTSTHRLMALLQEKTVLVAGQNTLLCIEGPPEIACRQLSFSYAGMNSPVLMNIDLTLPVGMYGISGRTGAGKSTLCRLLARLFPVEDGMLFIKGQDVNVLSLETVRSQIGYVSQQVLLFSDTIYNNILFGKPDADVRAVEAAARAAAIHDDIKEFPGNYNARIGERGVKLSGGQRQRIALARALLCDRPILIIDDGLSALDVATEQRVLTNIQKQYQGRLVLIVSHRINILRQTDRIIMLDQGKVAAACSHKEMLAASGLYATMAAKQRSHA